VYLVPPDVLANFIRATQAVLRPGHLPRRQRRRARLRAGAHRGPHVREPVGTDERGLRRLALRPSGSAYGAAAGHDPSLDWGGDAQPQAAQAAPVAPATPATATATAASAASPGPTAHYDDGFGEFPAASTATAPGDGRARSWQRSRQLPRPAPRPRPATAQALARLRALDADADDGEGAGIEGPIPDDEATAAAVEQAVRSQALDTPQPEYPGASRFAPAHASNFRTVRTPREIRQIVIHITDGGSRITGTIGWFQNPNQRNARNQPIHVSAHYVVGRDGEVVQMVRNNDIAWHANAANGHSIGIEHVANSTRRLLPTDDEYRGSARLVAWLCCQFGLPINRTHVLGHAEADTHTTHTDCPNSVWDWDRYMAMVQEEADALAAQSARPPPPRRWAAGCWRRRRKSSRRSTTSRTR
jgi:hypothetical protein